MPRRTFSSVLLPWREEDVEEGEHSPSPQSSPAKGRGRFRKRLAGGLVPCFPLFAPGARPLIFGITVWLLAILLLHGFPSVADADVYVYDAVAVQGEEIRLKAETRGALFTQGGELVEFFVDDVSLGKNLSGGDGMAYRQYTASRPGIRTVRAVSRNAEGTGFLLVAKRGTGVVAVDVEGSLIFKGFMFPGRPESRQALESVAKRYPLIYLQTGETNPKAIRFWLNEYEYAAAPMLPWDGGSLFDGLEKKGLRLLAVIGGPAVIESAARHKPQSFSFEPVKGAVRLKSWKDLEGHLK